MSAQMLARVGEALYGPRWQSDLARDLSISDRTMRRWLDGSSPIPDGVSNDLRALCAQRLAILEKLITALRG